MPRLDRRALVLGGVAAVLPLPTIGQATPDATPIDILIGLDDTVSRTFVAEDLKPSPSGTVRLEAYVFHFQSAEMIDWAMNSLIAGVILDRPTHEDDPISETEIAVGPIGAEVGARLIMVNDPDPQDADVYGVVSQQETWVQILVGYGSAETRATVIDLASKLIGRWPGDVLTDALPTLTDVPAGMTQLDG